MTYCGKPNVESAKELKEGAIKIFQDAKFTLHKWHSNAPELEGGEPKVETEDTFAKQQLGTSSDPKSSLLGLSWDKQKDKVSVVIPEMTATVSKRELLRNLARIYENLNKVQRDEKFHHFLANERIKWQFNPRRAPWWGGGVNLNAWLV